MHSNTRILLVDDELDMRRLMGRALRDHNLIVETASDGYRALRKLGQFDADVVLADVRMPAMSGLELLKRLRAADPDRPVVLMTAHGDLDCAVEAMQAGASGYLTKPVDMGKLLSVVDRAVERRRLRARASSADGQPRSSPILGSSPALLPVLDVIRQVAPSRASVLITGESGTGKELAAAAIHQQSTRSHGPFIKVHCAALVETLLESELFGHERGAFTGAVGRRDGRFQQADGGTLFLDEIGDISPATQVKLLRFLQHHELERVGGNETIHVDVRVIAATNRALSDDVARGRFREDLYYRLNVVSLEMPPLRARREDIPLLAQHFLDRLSAENRRGVTRFTPEALERLVAYDWPGNVRELENVIERAVVVCQDGEIGPRDLTPVLRAPERSQVPMVPGATVAEMEHFMILKTLEHTGGCKVRAARILGISPRTLHNRIREYRTGAPRAQPEAGR